MKPTVSIIIPTFNREIFIQKAIDSVLSQSYRDFELFVIDDGSRDRTPEIISKYKRKIFYVYIKNSGVSKARNTGIRLSRGKYISFLDSDDYWKPEKLEKQIDFMENHPEIFISQTGEIWIRNGKRVNPKKKHEKRSGDIFKKSLELCAVTPSSVMIRKELFETIGFFDESFPVCEDYDLWLRVTCRYNVGLISDKLVVKYGGHNDQLSKSTWGFDAFRIKAIEKLLSNTSLSTKKRQLAVESLKIKCIILEKGFRKRGKKENADYYRFLYRKYL